MRRPIEASRRMAEKTRLAKERASRWEADHLTTPGSFSVTSPRSRSHFVSSTGSFPRMPTFRRKENTTGIVARIMKIQATTVTNVDLGGGDDSICLMVPPDGV
jgi:hypothetical protein